MNSIRDVCLVVIYNHNYEKNVPVLDRIYRDRFRYVYHVMPFYQGSNPNVIGVYENSFNFNGYVAQAFSKLNEVDCSHYLFVADDMVINPAIDASNALEWMRLGLDEDFACDVGLVTNRCATDWSHALSAMVYLNARGNSCEGKRFLPSIEDARKKFENAGLDWRKGITSRFYRMFAPWVMPMATTPVDLMPIPGMRLAMRVYNRLPDSSNPIYPLAGGYSDLFAVSKATFPEFARICGILAAMRVHVEVAIPTAMVLASGRLKLAKSCGIK